MSLPTLKAEIQAALEVGKDASQNVDAAVDTGHLRSEAARKLAEAVQNYVKASLQTVIGGGVPTPQDGGATLKTTMAAQINKI